MSTQKMQETNTMYFRLRSGRKEFALKGTNQALQIVMDELFCNDDYVFRFERLPGYTNAQPMDSRR